LPPLPESAAAAVPLDEDTDAEWGKATEPGAALGETPEDEKSGA
jgi:hypothetical protein